MHIHVIIAGTNIPSNAETFGRAFVAGISEQSPETKLTWTILRNTPLDHFSLDFYNTNHDQGAAFKEIQENILKADGVVIASPIWNFSVPAHLKNLIDRMGSFALDATHSVGQLKGKPFYLLFTGGAPDAAWKFTQRTVSHVPTSIRYFGASVVGQLYEGRCTKGRGIFGLVVDQRPGDLNKAKAKGKGYAQIVEQYAKDGTLPVSHSLLTWFFQLGGKMKRALGM